MQTQINQPNWRKNARRIFTVIVCMLLLLEVLLRCTGRLETYSEKNNGSYVNPYDQQALKSQLYIIWAKNDTIYLPQAEFKYVYHSNNAGFIDKRNLEECNPAHCTIFLGDSFVFGTGAPQDSSAVVLLEKKAIENGENTQFFNAGMPGSDPFFETKLIERFFVPRGYKKFILAVNLSDISDYIFRGGSERFVGNQIQYRKSPWFEPLYRWSHIVRGLVHGPFKMDYTLTNKKKLKQERIEAVKAYSKLLNETYFNLQKSGVELKIIFQPYPAQYNQLGTEMEKEVVNFRYVREIYKNLVNAGIPCINLEKNFSRVLDSQNYLQYSWPVDGHFNGRGYDLYAGFIYESLKEK